MMKFKISVGVAICLVLAGFLTAQASSSVMIIANKASTPGAMAVQSPAVKACVQRVASYFVDRGIGVFDEDAMEGIYGDIQLAGGIDIDMPDNALIQIAMKHRAEVLVKLELFSIPAAPGDETVSARAIAKLYNVATARLFAMSEQYGSNVIPSPQALDAALIAAASKAGAAVGKRLYDRLETNHAEFLARLQRDAVPEYRLDFLGFSQKETDIILDIIYDDLGLEERAISEKQVLPNFAEVEIFTDANFSRLVRRLRQMMEREGLQVGATPVSYGKATFIREGFDEATLDVIVR